MDKRKQFGNEGEDFTAKYLQKEGFTILHRNYRKTFGEIDLIAQKKDLLIFVEVKRRKRAYFDMYQLITVSKQKKIIMVANEYIARYSHDEKICRFDIALIEGEKLTYLPNAFNEGEYSETP